MLKFYTIFTIFKELILNLIDANIASCEGVPMLMTKNGLAKLKQEQENLVQEEKRAIDAVTQARSYGDFSENAELEVANAWLDRVREKMAEIEQKIAKAEIFNYTASHQNKVNFGAQVFLEDVDTGAPAVYKIVGEVESNVQEGKISFQSPLAKALLGKNKDDECSFNAPSGEKVFLIKNIDYTWLED